MAGSAVLDNGSNGRLRTIAYEWTSDASGDVSGEALITVPGGTLHAISHVPGSGVTDQYDVVVIARRTLKSGNTYTFADALSGDGTNLSNSTNGAPVALGTPFPLGVNTQLEINISNAGNAQSGVFILHIWEEYH